MSNLTLILGCAIGFGSALTLIGLAGILVYIQKIDRRVSRLENSQPVRNAVVDTTEELMSHFIKLQREHDVTGALLDNTQIKIAYLRHNGNPNASWPEIIKWHNDKFPDKPNVRK